VVLYRNPLNGEPVEKRYTARPYAIVINNIEYAQPMCSIGQADILFEMLAEGGITRCLAVFDDIEGIDHIGAIRSTRPYLVKLAASLDAIFIHHGGSQDGYAEISTLGVDHLDALSGAGGAYYRDQNRLDSGYALEHTSFADGDDLLDVVADYDFETEYEDGVDYGYDFADAGSTVEGESATELKAVFGAWGKTTSFTYDDETGKWVFQCSLKNYGNTIEEFLDLVPYFMESVEHCEVLYETWGWSSGYELIDDEMIETNPEFICYCDQD
jgi:hypothetical protein